MACNSKFYKSTRKAYGLITPPLRAYTPTFYEYTRKAYGL